MIALSISSLFLSCYDLPQRSSSKCQFYHFHILFTTVTPFRIDRVSVKLYLNQSVKGWRHKLTNDQAIDQHL